MAASLVLVGFMGAGKSTAGRIAAHTLDRAFVDSDALIEARAGKQISEIFANDGEAAFRALERATMKDLADEEDLVIATGGGAFIDPEARSVLNEKAVTAYLKAPFDTLWDRISHGTERPLLKGEDARERMKTLFQSRSEAYEKALFQVDGTRPVGRVAEELVRGYHEWVRRTRSGVSGQIR